MNKIFSTILNKQEKEDFSLTQSEKEIAAAVRRQFANADEIIERAGEFPFTGRQFFSAERTYGDFPVIPIRKSEEFDIRKHTTSQRPYAHAHDFFELVYVHRGKCLQKFPNAPALSLREKQLCLLRPGIVHSIERCCEKDTILKMVIPRGLFEDTGGKIYGPGAAGAVVVHDKIPQTAEYLIFKILEEHFRKDKFAKAAIQSYLTLLFAELVRTAQKIDAAIEEELNEYLEENLQSARLSDFAAAIHYSKGYAGRLIKKKTGKSFLETLNLFRLKTAAALLLETRLTVEDVALQVGYANASGFYKQFCGFYGMTPSDYRKMF